MAEHETHEGRVVWEQEGVPEHIIHDMSALAWPGIFSGGKQIVSTQHQPSGSEDEGDELILVFNDNSAMRIFGKFEVTYRDHVSPEVEADVDGEVMAEEDEPRELTS